MESLLEEYIKDEKQQFKEKLLEDKKFEAQMIEFLMSNTKLLLTL